MGHRQLEEVIANLVRNAIQAMDTPIRRMLKLKTTFDDTGKVNLEVEDTGAWNQPRTVDQDI